MEEIQSDKEFSKVFKKHLKISTRSIAVRTLLSDRNIDRIDYKPYYQRNYVWDKVKASFFIESVLLGTEVPPLIFFKSGKSVEVIDGRQRFETLKKFKENDISLSQDGLMKLQILHKMSFNKLTPVLQDSFMNSKIRIFEFEVIDEPKLSRSMEDKIKKEIFRRYNTGITPLKSDELDNAKYDTDKLTELFKETLKTDKDFMEKVAFCFKGSKTASENELIASLLEIIRRYMILSSFPIKTYARGTSRTEIKELLYEFLIENIEDYDQEYLKFKSMIVDVIKIYDFFKTDERLDSRLIYECLLWAISVLDKEQCQYTIDSTFLNKLKVHYTNNWNKYETLDSHYYTRIVDRYLDTAEIVSSLTGANFDIYIKNDNFKNKVKELRQSEEEVSLTLDELSQLRILKPDPTSVPVEELLSEVTSSKFLLRPSYQRQEKINISKASSIIESILLGIYLPPIFIFKNSDGIKEVVDGQQRLLSILGFLGRPYKNEEGITSYSKNNCFSLKSLKIMPELNNKKYLDIDPAYKDKILDFDLNIIEIDERMNSNFSPVDLFLRLNSKPYPIMENSFEMWNSSVDLEVIQAIKELTDKNIEWFFIRSRDINRNRDRMDNEELITILAYIDYAQYDSDYSDINAVDFYPKQDRLNCRVNNKRNITTLLQSFDDQYLKKKQFMTSIENIGAFINNLKLILDKDDYKLSLNTLLNTRSAPAFTRSMQDLYVIWSVLNNANASKVASCPEDLNYDIQNILKYFKNVNNEIIDSDYFDVFIELIKDTNAKYK